MQSPHIQYITVSPTTHRYRSRPVGRVEPVTPTHQQRSEETPLELPEESLPTRLGDIMCRKVLTVKPGLPVRELVELFHHKHVSGFPVIDDDQKLLGLVSQADVISKVYSRPRQEASFYQTLFMTANYTEDEIPEAMTVGDIMTPFVYFATEDSSLQETLDLMLDNGIHRVVVTRHGHLVGLVSSMDLLKEFRRSLDR